MKIVLFFLSCFFSLVSSYSQSVQNDSNTNLQIKNAIALYNDFTDGQAPIFNGSAYIFYYFKMDGNPYFEKAGYAKGWIGYNGRIYTPVSLFFDINRNQLVILNTDSVYGIVMQSGNVDSFYLHGHTFISLHENQYENLYNTAFYDRLYNGQIQLLARRYKIMDDVIRDGLLTRVFYQKNRYYVHTEGLYYLVSNKKDVFKLFADKKSALKKQMRKAHIKFRRKNFETALLQATEFYDQLTH